MADDDSDKDPLSRLAIPFLGLIAFTWALVFGLLIVHLRGREWQGLDDTALILLAFLLGIALLPFVSQFSVAGLFEFKREIGQLSDKVDAVRNELSSLASATASVSQETSPRQTQNLSLDVSGLSELLADRLRQPDATTQAESPGAAQLTTSRAAKLAWQVAWISLKSALVANYRTSRVAEEGISAPALHQKDSDAAFQAATAEFAENPKNSDEDKEQLARLLRKSEAFASSDDVDIDQVVAAFKEIGSLTNILMANLTAIGVIGAAALGELQRDRALVAPFLTGIASELSKTDPPGD